MKRLLRIIINLFSVKSFVIHGSVSCAQATIEKKNSKLTFNNIEHYTSIDNLIIKIKLNILAQIEQENSAKNLLLKDIKVSDLIYKNKSFKFKFKVNSSRPILFSNKTYESKPLLLKTRQNLFFLKNKDFLIEASNLHNNIKLNDYLKILKLQVFDSLVKKINFDLISEKNSHTEFEKDFLNSFNYDVYKLDSNKKLTKNELENEFVNDNKYYLKLNFSKINIFDTFEYDLNKKGQVKFAYDSNLKANLKEFEFDVNNISDLNYENLNNSIKEQLIIHSLANNKINKNELDDLIANQKITIEILNQENSVLNQNQFDKYYGKFKIKITTKSNKFFKFNKTISNLNRKYKLDLNSVDFDFSKFNTLSVDQEITLDLQNQLQSYFVKNKIENDFDYKFKIDKKLTKVNQDSKILKVDFKSEDSRVEHNDLSILTSIVDKFDLALLNLKDLNLSLNSIKSKQDLNKKIKKHLFSKLKLNYPNIKPNYLNNLEISNTDDLSAGSKRIEISALKDDLYFKNATNLNLELNKANLNTDNLNLDEIESFESNQDLRDQIKTIILNWYLSNSDIYQANLISKDDIRLNFDVEENNLKVNFEIDSNNYFNQINETLILNNAKLRVDNLEFNDSIHLFLNDNFTIKSIINDAKNKIAQKVVKNLNFKDSIKEFLKTKIIENLNQYFLFYKDTTSLDQQFKRAKNLDLKLSENNSYKVSFDGNYLGLNQILLTYHVEWDENQKANLNDFDFSVDNIQDLNYANLKNSIKEQLLNHSLATNKITNLDELNELIANQKIAIEVLNSSDEILNQNQFNNYYGEFKIRLSANDNQYFKANKLISNLEKKYTLNLNEINFNLENLNTLNSNQEIIAELKTQLNQYLQNQNINYDFDYDVNIDDNQINNKLSKTISINFVSNEARFVINNASKTIDINKFDLSSLSLNHLQLSLNSIKNSNDLIGKIKNHLLTKLQTINPNTQLSFLDNLEFNNINNLDSGLKNIVINSLNNDLYFKNNTTLNLELNKANLNLNNLNLDEIESFESSQDLRDQIKTIILNWYLGNSDVYQANLISKSDISLNFTFEEDKLKVNFAINANEHFNEINGVLNLNNAKISLDNLNLNQNVALHLNQYPNTNALIEKAKNDLADLILNNFDFNSQIKKSLKAKIINNLNNVKLFRNIKTNKLSLKLGKANNLSQDLKLNPSLYKVAFYLNKSNYLKVNLTRIILTYDLNWNSQLKANLNDFNFSVDNIQNLNYANLISNLKQKLVVASLDDNKITLEQLNNLIANQKITIEVLNSNDEILNENQFNNYYGEFKLRLTTSNNKYFKSNKTIANLNKKFTLDLNEVNFNLENLNTLNTNQEIIAELKAQLNLYLQNQNVNYNFDYDVNINDNEVNNDLSKTILTNFVTNDSRFVINNASKTIEINKFDLSSLSLNKLKLSLNSIKSSNDLINKIKNHLLTKLQTIHSNTQLSFLDNLEFNNVNDLTSGLKDIDINSINTDLYFKNNFSFKLRLNKADLNLNNSNILEPIQSFNSTNNLRDQIKAIILNWYLNNSNIYQANLISESDITLNFIFAENKLKVNFVINANQHFNEVSGVLDLNNAKISLQNLNLVQNTTLHLNQYLNINSLIEKAKNDIATSILNNFDFNSQIKQGLRVKIINNLNRFIIFEENLKRNKRTFAIVKNLGQNPNLKPLLYKIKFFLNKNSYLNINNSSDLELTYDFNWNSQLKANLNDFDFDVDNIQNLNYASLISNLKQKLVAASLDNNKITSNQLDELIANQKIAIEILNSNDGILNQNQFNNYYGEFKISITTNDNRYFKSNKTIANLNKKFTLDLNEVNFNLENLNTLNSNQEIIAELKTQLNQYLQNQNINYDFDYNINIDDNVVDNDENKMLSINFESIESRFVIKNASKNIDINKFDLNSLNLDQLQLSLNSIKNSNDLINKIKNNLLTKLQTINPNAQLSFLDNLEFNNVNNLSSGLKNIAINSINNDLYFKNNTTLNLELNKANLNIDDLNLDEIESFESSQDLRAQIKTIILNWYLSNSDIYQTNLISKNDISLNFVFEEDKLKVNFEINANQYFSEVRDILNLNNAKISLDNLNLNQNEALHLNEFPTSNVLIEKAKNDLANLILNNFDFNSQIKQSLKAKIINNLNNLKLFKNTALTNQKIHLEKVSNLNQNPNLEPLLYKVAFYLNESNYLKFNLTRIILTYDLNWNSQLQANLKNFDFNVDKIQDLNYVNLKNSIKEQLLNYSLKTNKINYVQLDNLIFDNKITIEILNSNDEILNEVAFNNYYGEFKLQISTVDNQFFKANKLISNLNKNYILDLNEVNFNVENLNTLNSNQEIIAELKTQLNQYLQNQNINYDFDYDVNIDDNVVNNDLSKTITINFESIDSRFIINNASKIIDINKFDLNSLSLNKLKLSLNSIKNSNDLIEKIKNHLLTKLQTINSNVQLSFLNNLEFNNVNNLSSGLKNIAINSINTDLYFKNNLSFKLRLNKANLNINNLNLDDIESFESSQDLREQIKTIILNWYLRNSDIYQANLISKNDIRLNFVIEENNLKVNFEVSVNQYFNEVNGALNLNNAKINLPNLNLVQNTSTHLNQYPNVNSLIEKAKNDIANTILNNFDFNSQIKQSLKTKIINNLNSFIIFEEKLKNNKKSFEIVKKLIQNPKLKSSLYKIKFLLNKNNYLNLDNNNSLELIYDLNWNSQLKANLNDFNFSVDNIQNLNYASLISNLKQKLVVASLDNNKITLNQLDELIANQKIAIKILNSSDEILNQNQFNSYYGEFKLRLSANNNQFFKSNKLITNLNKNYILDLNEVNFNLENLNTLNSNEELIAELKTQLNQYLQNQSINYDFDYDVNIDDNVVNNDLNKTITINFESIDSRFIINNASKIIDINKFDLSSLSLNKLKLSLNSIKNSSDLINKIKNHLLTKLQTINSNVQLSFLDNLEFNNANNLSSGLKNIAINSINTDLYFKNNLSFKLKINKANLNLNDLNLDEITSFNSKSNLRSQIKTIILNWYLTQSNIYQANLISKNDITLNFIFQENNLKVNFEINANQYFNEINNVLNLNNAKLGVENLNLNQNVALYLNQYSNTNSLIEKAKNDIATSILNNFDFNLQIKQGLKTKIINNLNNLKLFKNLALPNQKLNLKRVENLNQNPSLEPLTYIFAFYLDDTNYLKLGTSRILINYQLNWNENLKANLNNFSFDINSIKQLNYNNFISSLKEQLLNYSLENNKISNFELNNLIANKIIRFAIFDSNNEILNQNQFNNYYGEFKLKLVTSNNQFFKSNKTISNLNKKYVLDLNEVNFNLENLNTLNSNQEIIAELKTQLNQYLQNQGINYDFDYIVNINDNNNVNDESKTLSINFESNEARFVIKNGSKNIDINKFDLSSLSLNKLKLSLNSIKNSSDLISNIKNHLLTKLQSINSNAQLSFLNNLEFNNANNLSSGSKNIVINSINNDSYFKNNLSFKLKISKADLNVASLNLDEINRFNSNQNLRNQIKTIILNWYLNNSNSYQPNLISKNDISLSFIFQDDKLKVNFEISANNYFNEISKTLALNNAKFNLNNLNLSQSINLFLNNYSNIDSLTQKAKEELATRILNNYNFNVQTKNALKTAFIESLNDFQIQYKVNNNDSFKTNHNSNLSNFIYRFKFNLNNNNYLNTNQTSLNMLFNLSWNQDLKADLNNFSFLNNQIKSLDIREKLIAFSLDENKISTPQLNKLLRNHKILANFYDENNNLMVFRPSEKYYGTLKLVLSTKENRFFKGKKTLILKSLYNFDFNNVNFDFSNLNTLNYKGLIINEIKSQLNQYLQNHNINYHFNYRIEIENDKLTSKAKNIIIRFISNDEILRFQNNFKNIQINKFDLSSLNLNQMQLNLNSINNRSDLINALKNHLLSKLRLINSDIELSYLDNLEFNNINNLVSGSKNIIIHARKIDPYFKNEARINLVLNRVNLNTNTLNLNDINSFNSKANLEEKIKTKIFNWYLQQNNFSASNIISKNDITLNFSFQENKLLVNFEIIANKYFNEVSGNLALNNAKIDISNLNLSQNINLFLNVYKNAGMLIQEAKNHLVTKILNRLDFNSQIKNALRTQLKNSLNQHQLLKFNSTNTLITRIASDLTPLDISNYLFKFNLIQNNYISVENNLITLNFHLCYDDTKKANLNQFNLNIANIENKNYETIVSNIKSELKSYTLNSNRISNSQLNDLILENKLIINFLNSQNRVLNQNQFNQYHGSFKIAILTNENKYFFNSKTFANYYKNINIDVANFSLFLQNQNVFQSKENIITNIKNQFNAYINNLYPNYDFDYDVNFINNETIINAQNINLSFQITSNDDKVVFLNNLVSVTLQKYDLRELNIEKLVLDISSLNYTETLHEKIKTTVFNKLKSIFPNFEKNYLDNIVWNYLFDNFSSIIPIKYDFSFGARSDNAFFKNSTSFKIQINKLSKNDLNWIDLNLDEVSSFDSVSNLKTQVKTIIKNFYSAKTIKYKQNLIHKKNIKILSFGISNNKISVSFKINANKYVNEINDTLILRNAKLNLRNLNFNEPLNLTLNEYSNYNLINEFAKKELISRILNSSDNFNFNFDQETKNQFKLMLKSSLINNDYDLIQINDVNFNVRGSRATINTPTVLTSILNLSGNQYLTNDLSTNNRKIINFQFNLNWNENLKANLNDFDFNLFDTLNLNYESVISELKNSLINFSLSENKIDFNSFNQLINQNKIKIQLINNEDVVLNADQFNNYYGQFKIRIITIDNQFFANSKTIDNLSKQVFVDLDQFDFSQLNLNIFDSDLVVINKIKQTINQYLANNFSLHNPNYDVSILRSTINQENKNIYLNFTSNDSRFLFNKAIHNFEVQKFNLDNVILEDLNTDFYYNLFNPTTSKDQQILNFLHVYTKSMFLKKLKTFNNEINLNHLNQLQFNWNENINLNPASKLKEFSTQISLLENNLYFYGLNKEFNVVISDQTKNKNFETNFSTNAPLQYQNTNQLKQRIAPGLKTKIINHFKQYLIQKQNIIQGSRRKLAHNFQSRILNQINTYAKNALTKAKFKFSDVKFLSEENHITFTYTLDVTSTIKYYGTITLKNAKLNINSVNFNNTLSLNQSAINNFSNFNSLKNHVKDLFAQKIIDTKLMSLSLENKKNLKHWIIQNLDLGYRINNQLISLNDNATLIPGLYTFYFTPNSNVIVTNGNTKIININFDWSNQLKANLNDFEFNIDNIINLNYETLISNLKNALINKTFSNNKITLELLNQLINEQKINIEILNQNNNSISEAEFNNYNSGFKIRITTINNRFFKNQKTISNLYKLNTNNFHFNNANLNTLDSNQEIISEIKRQFNIFLYINYNLENVNYNVSINEELSQLHPNHKTIFFDILSNQLNINYTQKSFSFNLEKFDLNQFNIPAFDLNFFKITSNNDLILSIKNYLLTNLQIINPNTKLSFLNDLNFININSIIENSNLHVEISALENNPYFQNSKILNINKISLNLENLIAKLDTITEFGFNQNNFNDIKNKVFNWYLSETNPNHRYINPEDISIIWVNEVDNKIGFNLYIPENDFVEEINQDLTLNNVHQLNKEDISFANLKERLISILLPTFDPNSIEWRQRFIDEIYAWYSKKINDIYYESFLNLNMDLENSANKWISKDDVWISNFVIKDNKLGFLVNISGNVFVNPISKWFEIAIR